MIDGGAGGGQLKIYEDSSNDHLVTIHLANPAFGNALVGVCTGLPVSANETSAIEAGTAGYFVIEDANQVPVLSGTVGVGAGFDLNFNTTSIPLGSAVNLDSIIITVPTTSASV